MRIQYCFALGLAWLSLAPGAFPQPPGKDERTLAAFQNALNQDGFDVTTGAASVLNLVAAWCAGNPGVDHALYSNNQPYLQVLVPKSVQEPGQVTSAFQLDPAEAIVMIGLTPPPARYFGFHPFLRTRVKADGTRQSLWATLGDAVNNATVKTTGPTPFNSPVAMIFTPDQGTDARVRAALQRAGYAAAIINTVVFPASMLNLGHGQTADELIIAVRNAMWQQQADGDAYIKNPPLHIFRVTPRAETIANPFRAPHLRIRGTGQTEMALMNKLGVLRQRIVANNPGLYATDIVPRPNWYEGYDYIQRGQDPWADSRDAFWLTAGYVPEFGSIDQVTLADDEFLMVYGPNHVATGKATYHSVNVYSPNDGKVPISGKGIDDNVFPGTAAPYFADDPATANLMYAYKISRNCGNQPNCLPLTIDGCPRLAIGPNTVLGLIIRTYLEPATKVGAAMPEILYDRVIKFSPRRPTQP
jgi:hypothetical protein